MFVIIETSDVEITGVHLAETREQANKVYERIVEELLLHPEWHPSDMINELPGTIRMCGDDSCCVQMIEQRVMEPEPEGYRYCGGQH